MSVEEFLTYAEELAELAGNYNSETMDSNYITEASNKQFRGLADGFTKIIEEKMKLEATLKVFYGNLRL